MFSRTFLKPLLYTMCCRWSCKESNRDDDDHRSSRSSWSKKKSFPSHCLWAHNIVVGILITLIPCNFSQVCQTHLFPWFWMDCLIFSAMTYHRQQENNIVYPSSNELHNWYLLQLPTGLTTLLPEFCCVEKVQFCLVLGQSPLRIDTTNEWVLV